MKPVKIEQGRFVDLGAEETERRIREWQVVRYNSLPPTMDAVRVQKQLDDENVLIKNAASLLQFFEFTVLEVDYAAFPEQPGMPMWKHAGTHAKLGKLYWNRFKTAHPEGVLQFHDSPDFSGEFEGIKFYGDIGSVSVITFLEVIRWFREGELWISVAAKKRKEYVFEALSDVPGALKDMGAFPIPTAPPESL